MILPTLSHKTLQDSFITPHEAFEQGFFLHNWVIKKEVSASFPLVTSTSKTQMVPGVNCWVILVEQATL